MSSLFSIFAVEKSILILIDMARKSKIKYDPTKTVEENARLNNVTKDGIYPKTDINRLGINPDIFNEIIAIEDFTPTIAEPYRIDGISGISTIQTNIYNDDFPKSKFDVVTIPSPTKTLHNILNQCLKVCKNKVALLLPIRYMTDPSIYKTHPLFRLYVIPNSNYAWYVWAKNYDGATEIKWLNSTETTETEKESLKTVIPTEKPIIITPKPNRIYAKEKLQDVRCKLHVHR